jgi:hypothetical protein
VKPSHFEPDLVLTRETMAKTNPGVGAKASFRPEPGISLEVSPVAKKLE